MCSSRQIRAAREFAAEHGVGRLRNVLSLDSPSWSKLKHAYGGASDIPALLRQLNSLPASEGQSEPWFSLWSALAHQGDVYPASFAAVPHVVEALSRAPEKADSAFFQFPAWIEICRHKQKTKIPAELDGPYKKALAKLPSLVAAAANREWDEGFLVCALSAVAAAKGYPSVAEAVLEMSSETAEQFMEWLNGQ